MNSSVPSARKYRSKEWVLAHQVRSKDGKWEVNPNDKEAVEIARKVVSSAFLMNIYLN